MSCDTAGTSYNIDGSVITVSASPSEDDKEVCRATQILERLHKDFTEKYYTTADKGTDATKTLVDGAAANTPSYYLRKQPISNAPAAGSEEVNRFYLNSINSEAASGAYRGDVFYRKMTSAIMKGVTDVAESTFNIAPNSITTLTNFNSPGEFKGIYGLNRVNEILETKINTLLSTLTPSSSSSSSASSGDAITRFGKRKDIKNTLEEVAYRENQIYREKFLNIILIVVGIFVVGSQLVQKYFGGGGGGGVGGGGAGLGGLFGFGFGGSGGLFSRFGGLGLGSSGRSHFDIGNLFKNSSYTLKQR
jgi:hypothetical protein